MDGKTLAKLLMILGGILVLAACFLGMRQGFSILIAVLAGSGGILLNNGRRYLNYFKKHENNDQSKK